MVNTGLYPLKDGVFRVKSNTIEFKSDKSSRLARFNSSYIACGAGAFGGFLWRGTKTHLKPPATQTTSSTSTALGKSHSSYSWINLSEFDTLVNQLTTPHQSEAPFVGVRVFQNRGVCGQAFSRAPTTPCFVDFFALAPICARPECGKSSSCGNACYAGYAQENVLFLPILIQERRIKS